MPLEFRGAGFLKADNLRVCPRHGLSERALPPRRSRCIFSGGFQRNPPIFSTRVNIVCRLIIVCLNIEYNVRNFVIIVAGCVRDRTMHLKIEIFENLRIEICTFKFIRIRERERQLEMMRVCICE